jgi:N-acetyl-gamma-glutamyl-phosphate reductase
MNKKKIGIIGSTGFTGVELIRLLWDHPGVELSWLTSRSYAGQKISDIFPYLKGKCEIDTEKYSTPRAKELELELVFIALPHGLAQEFVPDLLSAKIKVIDLGADYRLKDVEVYKEYYGEHKSPELIEKAVYGLPEVNREKIAKAELVANPGCYVTAATLALLPLKYEDLIEEHSIIIDAKSGVSGAGRKLSQTTHFNEVNNNFSAYNLTVHRHQPEIEQNIGDHVVFSPHLLPIDRGILVTAYADLKKEHTEEDLLAKYYLYYQDDPFIKIVDHLPSIKDVVGSNYCAISLRIDHALNKVVIVSVIDNLVKGASGQAVQNMNLMFGLEETLNIDNVALYP